MGILEWVLVGGFITALVLGLLSWAIGSWQVWNWHRIMIENTKKSIRENDTK